jgi:hypothetical protein
LYWGDKSIYLDEVRAIRLGTEIDPVSQVSPPTQDIGKKALKEGKPSPKVLYGTEILRRNCKADDMALAFSLILPLR